MNTQSKEDGDDLRALRARSQSDCRQHQSRKDDLIKHAVKACNFYWDETLQQKSNQRALIIGGGEIGCEIVWFVALQGRPVFVVDTLPRAINGFPQPAPHNRFTLMEGPAENSVQLMDEAMNISLEGSTKTSADRLVLERDGIICSHLRPTNHCPFETIAEKLLHKLCRSGRKRRTKRALRILGTGNAATVSGLSARILKTFLVLSQALRHDCSLLRLCPTMFAI